MVLYGYMTQRDIFSKVDNFTSAFAFSFYSVFVAVACRGLFKAASSTTYVRLHAVHVAFIIGVTVVWTHIEWSSQGTV